MERHRITVIGGNVTTVQRVSSYCLKKNLEVLPYYGIPKVDDINLFAPYALVLCLPMPDDFQCHIPMPYILWSEQVINEGLVTTQTEELYVRLQKAQKTLNQPFAHSQSCCLDAIVNAEFVENHTHIGLNCS